MARTGNKTTAEAIANLKARCELLSWVADRIDYVTREQKNLRQQLDEQEQLPEEERDWNYEYRLKDYDINVEQLKLLDDISELLSK